MRKLKLQMQLSMDGFVAGPQGEMDWISHIWSEDLLARVGQLTDPIDTIILGRNLAEGFIPHWTAALRQPEPEPGAQKFVETPKFVFSRTITHSPWDNTTMCNGELAAEINALKQQPGGDIMVYGGGQLVSALIAEKLIDELHLFVNPAIIGTGMPIFKDINAKQDYTLLSARSFDCGIVELVYSPA